MVALSVRAANVGWTVIAQQPVMEAFELIRAALWRSLVLIGIGIAFAFVLAYWRACRMWVPIRQLEDGVERIGMGSSTIASRSTAATNWSNWPSDSTRWRKSLRLRSRSPSASIV